MFLRATQLLQRGVAPLVGDGYLVHVAKGTGFYIFSVVDLMFELTFGRCKNLKRSPVQVSHVFYPGNRTFGSCLWKGSTENLETLFFGYQGKKLEKLDFQNVLLLSLASEKSHVDQRPEFMPSPKECFLGPRAVSLAQNGIG